MRPDHFVDSFEVGRWAGGGQGSNMAEVRLETIKVTAKATTTDYAKVINRKSDL